MVQTMFGGSVHRGTYVNGLSDIDVLLIINHSSLANLPPANVIGHIKNTLSIEDTPKPRKLRPHSSLEGRTTKEFAESMAGLY